MVPMRAAIDPAPTALPLKQAKIVVTIFFFLIL